MSRTRSTVVRLTAVAGVMALAACSSSGGSNSAATSSVRDQSNDVPFTGCEQVKCVDTLNGAKYEIVMPTKWNGTLLIYSHGYREAKPAPPTFAPVDTSPEPAPGWSSGQKQIGQKLLDEGYAIAGSAYATNGWDVADGVKAGQDLHQFFTTSIGTPKRTYVWGDSLGGLITQEIAEKNPDWVNGAAPFCGVLAGVVPNYDLALDTAYAVKTLIDPQMKITGFSSYEEAVATFTSAAAKMIAAAGDVKGGGTSKILYIASLVDAPTQTQTYDGATIESKVKGITESLITAVGFGTFARYDVEQRYGGNISTNATTDYAVRISDSDKALVNSVTPGAAEKYTAQLTAGERVNADATARAKAIAEGGDPQGLVKAPTITIHTAADPLVIDQNESFFKARYQARQSEGAAQADLFQLFTVAPATYPEQPGAPYGAGHCNFTPETRLAVIDLLNNWVRNGVTPATGSIQAALPTATTGYQSGYVASPWPDPAAGKVG